MPTSDARIAAQNAARELLQALSQTTESPSLRVVESSGGLVCVIVVGVADEQVPSLNGERRKRDANRRVDCKRDIVEAVRTAGVPLTRKQIVRVLRKDHGPGTIAKALADLTASGELLNRKDKRGYRLPEWPKRPETPSLFD